MTKYNKLLLLTSLTCLPGISQAASTVSDTFDANIGSWQGNTIDTTVSHISPGGNPGGYMGTENTTLGSTFDVIGAQNTAADYSGVFADGIWNIKVDLSFVNGDFTDSWLRFRYQNSSNNGWHISLEDTSFFDATWQSYSVTFDTTWDDATAIANGWVKDDASVVSFSTLWDDTYNSEVRILGGPRMVAGIDNYMATYRTPAVPVPAAVWLFGSGLLGLAGVARRKIS